MRVLILKEVRGFLGSLIGQVVVVVFLLLTGLFLWVFPNNILDTGYADLSPLFFIAPWVFLFLVPAVTMRSFSEERRTGTIELLLTKPLTELQLVLAKYIAAVILIFFALLPTAQAQQRQQQQHYSNNEIVDAGHRFFGTTSRELAESGTCRE